MIVEDEGFVVNHNEQFENQDDSVHPDHGRPTRTLDKYIQAHQQIRNKTYAVEGRPDRASLEPSPRFVFVQYLKKILTRRVYLTVI